MRRGLGIRAARGGVDARDPAPAASTRKVRSPVLLVHSGQDGFAPADHSERIYEAIDRTRTRLVIPEWEAEHAHSFTRNPQGYTAVVDGFLAELTPRLRRPAEAVGLTSFQNPGRPPVGGLPVARR
jgi:fermentation-respiration switch protein FrsA (DUF1100 family)